MFEILLRLTADVSAFFVRHHSAPGCPMGPVKPGSHGDDADQSIASDHTQIGLAYQSKRMASVPPEGAMPCLSVKQLICARLRIVFLFRLWTRAAPLTEPRTLVPDYDVAEQLRMLREAAKYVLEVMRSVGDQALAQLSAERSDFGLRAGGDSNTRLFLRVSREFRETMALTIRISTAQRRHETERRRAASHVGGTGEREESEGAQAAAEAEAMRAILPGAEFGTTHGSVPDDAAPEQVAPVPDDENAGMALEAPAVQVRPDQASREMAKVLPAQQGAVLRRPGGEARDTRTGSLRAAYAAGTAGTSPRASAMMSELLDLSAKIANQRAAALDRRR
jgi:hypothetical protein